MFLLVVGCFMETTAILLIAVPTFLPLILQLGIDPVHFGLIIILNLLIGATTPPFGVLLFIVMDIAKVSFGRMVRAMLPFYLPLGIALLRGHVLAVALALAAAGAEVGLAAALETPRQSPSSDSPGWSSGRRPSGHRYFRSGAWIGRSLMLAMRRCIRPFAANSQFSLP